MSKILNVKRVSPISAMQLTYPRSHVRGTIVARREVTHHESGRIRGFGCKTEFRILFANGDFAWVEARAVALARMSDWSTIDEYNWRKFENLFHCIDCAGHVEGSEKVCRFCGGQIPLNPLNEDSV